MRTEEPAERLHRRLGADDDQDDDAAADEPPDKSLSRWLPDSTPAEGPGWLASVRADPGRAGVIALGVVGVVAVLVTVFTVMRDRTPPVASANLPPVQMVSSAAPTPAAPEGPVVVSVVGLVHKPGLVTLTAGARIADALDAAGGALDGADLIGLNMARRVTDGEQIIVGIAAPAGQPPVMGSSIAPDLVTPTGAAPTGAAPADKPAGATEPVNLNTATVEQLDALPGIGPVTAAAIIAWRDANGHFASVDQLGDVDGIGPARLEKLRDSVRV
jgi:competence protein ComEA